MKVREKEYFIFIKTGPASLSWLLVSWLALSYFILSLLLFIVNMFVTKLLLSSYVCLNPSYHCRWEWVGQARINLKNLSFHDFDHYSNHLKSNKVNRWSTWLCEGHDSAFFFFFFTFSSSSAQFIFCHLLFFVTDHDHLHLHLHQ